MSTSEDKRTLDELRKQLEEERRQLQQERKWIEEEKKRLQKKEAELLDLQKQLELEKKKLGLTTEADTTKDQTSQPEEVGDDQEQRSAANRDTPKKKKSKRTLTESRKKKRSPSVVTKEEGSEKKKKKGKKKKANDDADEDDGDEDAAEKPSSDAKSAAVSTPPSSPSRDAIATSPTSFSSPSILKSGSSPNLKIPVVDMSKSQLTELPEDLVNRAEYLQKLYIFRNSIKRMGSVLSSLKNLQLLDANNNNLTKFPKDLMTLPQLKEINFADNFITKFPKDMSKMNTLTKLDLTANTLKELPPSLCTIPKLSVLILSFNKLKTLPAEIGNLKHLTQLFVTNNELETLPDQIESLERLEYLDVKHNYLKSTPAGMSSLGALSVLDLSHNMLTEIPSCLSAGTLCVLHHCDLSWNQISSIPHDCFSKGGLDALEELVLAHNSITELPNSLFEQVTSLTLLDAKNNKIASIPPTISNLGFLNTLDLSGNLLESIPEEIASLNSLQHLILFGNRLASLPPLNQLYYVTQLNVGFNKLTDTIDLDGLECLEELTISGNEFTSLPETIGESCPNLRVIYANNNKLSDLPESMGNLQSLEVLDVSYNQLKQIPSFVFQLEGLRVLTLHHNALENSPQRASLNEPLDDDDGPWDCVDNWNNFDVLVELDISHNKLQYLPAGLKDIRKFEVIATGNPLKEPLPTNGLEFVQSKRFKLGVSEFVGRRPSMEDRFCIRGSLNGKENVDLFALFDGHAGREAADFAAATLPNLISAKLNDDKKPIETVLTEAFEELHASFKTHATSSSRSKHCGCTAAVVLIVDNKIYVANVGDSRVVTSKGDRLTVDHKPRTESARIRANEGGYVVGDGWGRVNGVLAVSRSIGDFYMHPHVIPTPHVTSIDLKDDIDFLIIACDGVWDEVSDSKAAELVRELVAQNKLDEAATLLRDTAYAFGSDDNISAIIVKLR